MFAQKQFEFSFSAKYKKKKNNKSRKLKAKQEKKRNAKIHQQNKRSSPNNGIHKFLLDLWMADNCVCSKTKIQIKAKANTKCKIEKNQSKVLQSMFVVSGKRKI